MFAAAYRRLLDAVVAKNPQAKIAVITPFCGAFHDELFALVADYNKAHGTDIFVVDTPAGCRSIRCIRCVRDTARLPTT